MDLNKYDLHLEFDTGARRLTVWSADHKQLMACEARNKTVRDGQLGHDGNCASGVYRLGRPVAKDTVPFGRFFILMEDFGDNHAMANHHRAGIGLHGGGSGLAAPFAPRQGWQITRGCVRLQNVNLEALVGHVKAAHRQGGVCYITVTALLPGAAEETDDWGPSTDLDPDE